MFILQLNHMEDKAELVKPIACSEFRENLQRLLDEEAVEPYKDGRFLKSFRKDGPLEWFNPPNQYGDAWINVKAISDVGTEEDWAKVGRIRYQQFIESIHLKV